MFYYLNLKVKLADIFNLLNKYYSKNKNTLKLFRRVVSHKPEIKL